MRRTLLLTLVAVSLQACVTYQTVTYDKPFIEVYDNLASNKDALFLKANAWMVSTFTNAESVIQYSDKAEGALIGKYLLNGGVKTGAYSTTLDTRIYAIIDIRVKDNKVRFSVEPQGTWKYDSSGMTVYNYSKAHATHDIEKLAENFRESLSKEAIDF